MTLLGALPGNITDKLCYVHDEHNKKNQKKQNPGFWPGIY